MTDLAAVVVVLAAIAVSLLAAVPPRPRGYPAEPTPTVEMPSLPGGPALGTAPQHEEEPDA